MRAGRKQLPHGYEAASSRGPQVPVNRALQPHLPVRHIYHSPMVRNSAAIQMAPWSGASSQETDNPGMQTTTGNLHGAIGEHRRGSRSSSSSSTNSSNGIEVVCIATSGHERVSDLLETPFVTDNTLSNSVPDVEPEDTRAPSDSTELPGARLDTSDSSSGIFTGRLNTSDKSRQGRPITSQSKKTNASSSQSAPQGFDMNMQLLSEPVFSPNHFIAGINQDMQQMGMQIQFDYTNNSMNLPANSVADAGYQAGFQSAYNTYSVGPAPSGFMDSDIAHHSHINEGGHEMYNTGNNFVYSSLGVAGPQSFLGATGGYPYYPQGQEYFTGHHENFQAFSSQTFNFPPPVPPSQKKDTFMPEPTESGVTTCSLCNQHYKWPHVLKCLHVYCFPCLVSKFDPVGKSIECPECCQTTCLNDVPSSLKLDYQRIRSMRGMNVSPFNCTSCTRDNAAVITCTTCMAYLCSECQDGHRNMNQFQTHTLAPISKIGQCSNGDYTIICEKHPLEPLTRYCDVCKNLVCCLCVPEHKHPNSNDCTPVEEVYPIVSEELNNLTEDAHIRSKELDEVAKRSSVILQQMEGRKRACRKQIEEYADYCRKVIDQNCSAALELLDKTCDDMEYEVLVWTKRVSKLSKLLQTVVEFNRRTVKYAAINETIDLLETMDTAYKTLIEDCSHVVKNEEGLHIELKFDPNYKESHALLNQNFLSISYSLNGVEHKVSHSNDKPSSDSVRHSFLENKVPSVEFSDTNYQFWSPVSNTMPISTWNGVGDKEKKNGTYIQHLDRYRTKTAYTYMFGGLGQNTHEFTEPSGQAFLKDGSYVICDTNSHRILHYSASHQYIRTIGQHPNVPPLVEEQEQRSNGIRIKALVRQEGFLYFPNRVAICPITQNIVVTERPPSHDIQIFTIDGQFVRCFGGNILQHPRGVAIDEEGMIIVVECKVMKLVMFKQDGTFITSYSLAKDVEFPNDVAAKCGKIFISDNRGHCVHVCNYKAEFMYKIGNEHVTYYPIGVSVNHLNQVVVMDNHNTFNITVFDMSGTVLHLFESVNKLAKCHTAAIHPNSLELMLSTKACFVYFFSYDPEGTHSLTPQVKGKLGHKRHGQLC